MGVESDLTSGGPVWLFCELAFCVSTNKTNIAFLIDRLCLSSCFVFVFKNKVCKQESKVALVIEALRFTSTLVSNECP